MRTCTYVEKHDDDHDHDDVDDDAMTDDSDDNQKSSRSILHSCGNSH